MLGARWSLAIACIAACAASAASGPTRVRDIDGRPLPPNAASDASGSIHTVECSDGITYLVVTNRPPFHRSTRMEAALREREKTIDDVCDRILANGP
jgi:hypothetical protein